MFSKSTFSSPSTAGKEKHDLYKQEEDIFDDYETIQLPFGIKTFKIVGYDLFQNSLLRFKYHKKIWDGKKFGLQKGSYVTSVRK